MKISENKSINVKINGEKTKKTKKQTLKHLKCKGKH